MTRIRNIISATLLFVIGLGFLTAVTVRVMDTLAFIDKAKTADGVVIVTKHAKRHPRIEYTNAAGEKRWFLANEWLTGFRFVSYRMGQHVQVLYDPADPVAFSVDDFASLYTVPVTGGIVGIVFMALGVYALSKKVTFTTKAMVSAGISLFIGIGCLAIVSISIKPTREFISKAQIAEGVVFELPHGGSHPRVSYTTASGEKDWVPANGFISGYKIGERVRVLYEPDPKMHYISIGDYFSPASPNIDDFGALYPSFYFEGLFGFIIITAGILALFGLLEFTQR